MRGRRGASTPTPPPFSGAKVFFLRKIEKHRILFLLVNNMLYFSLSQTRGLFNREPKTKWNKHKSNWELFQCTIIGQLTPTRNAANTKTNPNPNSNPNSNRGAIFVGQLSGYLNGHTAEYRQNWIRTNKTNVFFSLSFFV